ncbi:MAG: PAS domain S-box protein [Oligoflexales bacterium]
MSPAASHCENVKLPVKHLRKIGGDVVGFLIIGSLYFVGGKIGLAMDALYGFSSLVWPPSGIAIAGLFILGIRFWPAVALGAFFANWQNGAALGVAAGISVGNTLEAVLAAYLLRKRSLDPNFSRVKDVITFVICAALASTCVSATIGTISVWSGNLEQFSPMPNWMTWWLGDMLGTLVFAPILLVLHGMRFTQTKIPRHSKGTFWIFPVALALVCYLLIYADFGSSYKPYLAFPFIIWVGLRFHIFGAVLATLAIAITGIVTTAGGHGPFSADDLFVGLRNLHFFLTSLSITGLCIAAAFSERADSERRASESLARATMQQRIEEIVDAVKDYAIFSLDIHGKITTWNEGAERITGYDASEAMGQHFSMLYTAETLTKRHPNFELDEASKDGRFEDEGWRLRKDGSRFWANAVITTIYDAEGNIAGFSKVTRDITQQKETAEREQNLRELEFQTVFNHASAGVAQVDLTTRRFVRVNPKFTELTGYSTEELSQMIFLDVSHPDDVEETRKLFQLLLGGSVPDFAVEKRYVRKDNSVIWVHVTVTMIPDPTGKPLRAVGVVQDVTEHRIKVAEQRFLAKASVAMASLDLKKTLENLAQIAVPEIADWCSIHMLNEDRNLERVAVTHADAEKTIQAQALPKHPSNHASNPLVTVIQSGKPILMSTVADADLVCVASDEAQLENLRSAQLLSAIVVPLRHNETIFGTLTMVSSESRRRYNERNLAFASEIGMRAGMAIENARLYSEAVKTNRLKDEFLANLSHELRTPLNSIVGWSQLLHTGQVDEHEFLPAISSIYRNAQAQSQLIEDLLDVSRIITGKLSIHPTSLDLGTIISDALESVELAARSKSIQIEITSDPNPGTMYGDVDRLRQVFWNILSNAVRYTPQGGSITIQRSRNEDAAEVRITDTGKGIDPKLLPYVFDRFWQENTSKTREHGGLGLGLSIVRHIVEAHGGSVRAESQGLGLGATFIVSLPLQIAEV